MVEFIFHIRHDLLCITLSEVKLTLILKLDSLFYWICRNQSNMDPVVFFNC